MKTYVSCSSYGLSLLVYDNCTFNTLVHESQSVQLLFLFLQEKVPEESASSVLPCGYWCAGASLRLQTNEENENKKRQSRDNTTFETSKVKAKRKSIEKEGGSKGKIGTNAASAKVTKAAAFVLCTSPKLLTAFATYHCELLIMLRKKECVFLLWCCPRKEKYL